MARIAFTCTLGQSLGGGLFNTSAGSKASVSTSAVTAATDAATVVTLAADVATAVGVLDADGASPTEAHVNDLVTAWDLLATAITAANASAAAASSAGNANAVFDIDNAVITTKNAARAALRAIDRAIDGSGLPS